MIRAATAVRAVFCFAALAALALSCSNQEEAPGGRDAPDAAFGARSAAARALVASMGDDELIGQLLMIGVAGVSHLAPSSLQQLNDVRPGAIILFGYNVSTVPQDMAALTAAIREAAAVRGLPPFIAIDHEGGSVYRFKGGLTRLPSAMVLGAAGIQAASAAGAAAGSELRALGITLNLAPVVEALNASNRAFLVDRAWSTDPAASGRLAWSFAAACQSQGVAACAKHFPGNGPADPHAALPVLGAASAELDAEYLEPFRPAIRGGVSVIMLSHAVVPALDPSAPASLSAPVVAALRERLGFRGIVLTDDLVMAALSRAGGPGVAAVAALSAGADMLMVSGGPAVDSVRTAVRAALADGRLPRARLEDAAVRIVAQKLRFGLDAETAADRQSRLAALGQTVERNRSALMSATARR